MSVFGGKADTAQTIDTICINFLGVPQLSLGYQGLAMKPLRTLAIILFVSVLLANIVATGFAEPAVIEVASIQAGHDQRTGEPVLTLKLGGISNKEFMGLSSRRLGKTSDLRGNGRVVFSPVFREPMLSPSLQISGHLTENTVKAIAEECAQPGAKCEIVIPDAD